VVTALLGHPEIRINLGKLDTNASPLFEAAQEGREEVMLELLGASRVDINQATIEGVSPLCVACELGHEHVVDCLLKVHDIGVDHKLKNGATALAIAANHGHVKIVESLVEHSRRNGLEMPAGVFPMLSSTPFPMRDQFKHAKQYHEAVLKWAEAAAQPKFPLSKEPEISSVKSKMLSNRNLPFRKYRVVHDPCDEQKSEWCVNYPISTFTTVFTSLPTPFFNSPFMFSTTQKCDDYLKILKNVHKGYSDRLYSHWHSALKLINAIAPTPLQSFLPPLLLPVHTYCPRFSPSLFITAIPNLGL
jgi:ankyrin repeat protein